MRALTLLAFTFFASGCAEPLLTKVEVASAKGGVRGHAPSGPGWKCTPHDVEKESFAFQGIKCVDAEGVVLTAKLYEVDVADARTAELFCIQDWKAAYGSLFSVVVSATSGIKDRRGIPACEVVLEGTTTKGPWRIWEIHAPNGRKMLQMNVSGSLPVVQKKQRQIDAWLDDVTYDLKLPGQ